MFWFLLLFPLLIYPWGFDPYYTVTKTGYLYLFVVLTWIYIIYKRKIRVLFPATGNHKVLYLLLLLLSLIEISTFLSDYTYTSVHGTLDRREGLITYFCYFSVFVFSYRLMDRKKGSQAIFGMALVSIAVSIYAILQHYSLDFLPRNSAMRNYTGTYTFFDNPNFFGSYLVIVMLLGLTAYLTEDNKKMTALHYAAVCLGFVALIFSNTRSAYVGVFFGTVFLTAFVIIKRKYLWKKWAVLLISCAVLASMINMAENGRYADRATTVVTDSIKVATKQATGHEGSNRLFIWRESLPLVKEYFWIGSGPDTFEFVFPITPEKSQQYFGNSNTKVDKAHNEYLQIAVTLGTPALLVYLLFLLVILYKAYQAVRKAKGKEQLILYGLIAVVLGYLAQAFFNISTVPVAPLFWACLGITLSRAETSLKGQSGGLSIEKYKSAS